jgi:DNA-binding transcriptional regulator YiaG
MIWHPNPNMSADTFRQALKTLGLSGDACARLLGYGYRQIYKWRHGHATVPTHVAILLNLLIEVGLKPVAPKKPKPET